MSHSTIPAGKSEWYALIVTVCGSTTCTRLSEWLPRGERPASIELESVPIIAWHVLPFIEREERAIPQLAVPVYERARGHLANARVQPDGAVFIRSRGTFANRGVMVKNLLAALQCEWDNAHPNAAPTGDAEGWSEPLES
jgi:hypothetical protein